MRWLEWSWDPDPTDTTYEVIYALVMREPDGSVDVDKDRHREGLFARETWLRLLAEAGLQAEVVRDPWGRDVFRAMKKER
jgi:hypothetical protein